MTRIVRLFRERFIISIEIKNRRLYLVAGWIRNYPEGVKRKKEPQLKLEIAG